jgi:hypothetical protein
MGICVRVGARYLREKCIPNFAWRSQKRKAVLEGTSLTSLADVAIVVLKGEIEIKLISLS